MDGLAGRQVTPVSDDQKVIFAKIIDGLSDWRNRHKISCDRCRQVRSLPRTSTSKVCQSCCEHPVRVRGYMAKANGTFLAQTMCFDCGVRADIRTLDRKPILDVCIRDNHADSRPPCERCYAETGTEWHHWAPSAIFADAELWPKAWLCPTCHRAWHAAMARAGGRSLPPEDRASRIDQ